MPRRRASPPPVGAYTSADNFPCERGPYNAGSGKRKANWTRWVCVFFSALFALLKLGNPRRTRLKLFPLRVVIDVCRLLRGFLLLAARWLLHADA